MQTVRIVCWNDIDLQPMCFDVEMSTHITQTEVAQAIKNADHARDNAEPGASYECRTLMKGFVDTYAFMIYSEDFVGCLVTGFIYTNMSAGTTKWPNYLGKLEGTVFRKGT